MSLSFRRGVHTRKFALALPGQGIVRSGFLAPYKKYQHHFQQHLEIVDEALGEKFSENLFNESESFSRQWLLKTSNAQPAILTTTYAILEIIKRELYIDLAARASFLLGHSLGEYTALAVAGIIDLPTAVRLVRKRALLMEEVVASEREKNIAKHTDSISDKDSISDNDSISDGYGMLALMIRPTLFDTVIVRARQKGILANVNSRQQIVVSGQLQLLQLFVAEINSDTKLVLRAVKLPVEIPFHNELLQPVVQPLRDEIYSHKVREQRVPIILNLTGKPSYDHHGTIANTLEANYRPVQWVDSLEYLVGAGVSTVVNVGPGEVLQGLNLKFAVDNISVDMPESFEKVREFFSIQE